MVGDVMTLSSSHLLGVNNGSRELDEETGKIYHRLVQKILFTSNHSCTDMQTCVTFLTTGSVW